MNLLTSARTMDDSSYHKRNFKSDKHGFNKNFYLINEKVWNERKILLRKFVGSKYV